MDAIALLERDHRTVEGLFHRYESLPADRTEERTETVQAIIRELSVHAAIEEQILYPAVEDVLADGGALAAEAVQEHQDAKEALAELDRMDVTDPPFDRKVRSLIAEVRHHVEEEESEMFPKLRAAVSTAKLDELGERMAAAKDMAPTRPHPHAPSSPPGNLVAGAVAGLVDRVRDAASGRTSKETSGRPRKPTARATAKKRTTRAATSAKKKTTARAATSAKKKTTARAATSSKKKTTARATTSAKKSTARAGSSSRRTSGPVFHVTADPKGGWRAEKRGASRAAARSGSKQDVVKRARELAKAQRGRLVIHGQNGRIQEERTYGPDPRRTRG